MSAHTRHSTGYGYLPAPLRHTTRRNARWPFGLAAPRVQTLVPVPVACQEAVPARPIMPTEALVPGVLPWTLLRAALAEIDRREGYEVQLRAALIACTAVKN